MNTNFPQVKKKKLKNSKTNGKVTKYLKLMLTWLFYCGLFKLPHSSRSPSGNRLHSIFMTGVITLYCFYTISSGLCVFIFSIKSYIEFLNRLFETTCLTVLFIETLLLNRNAENIHNLLDRIDKFNSSRKISERTARIERWTFCLFAGLILFPIVFKFSLPFLPMKPDEYELAKEIYALSHPERALPLCLWLPFQDTSERCWFYALYVLEVCMVTITLVMALVEALFFPFILLHLGGQYLMFSSRLKCLGKAPPYSYLQELKGPNNGLYLQDKQAWELLEMRNSIVRHQNLLEFRTLLNAISGRNFVIRIVLVTFISSLSAHPLSILSAFDRKKQSLFVGEAILVLGFYFYNCLMSETLEWSNGIVRRSIYASRWYVMCPGAQRMMLMFLHRTQRPQYIRTLGGVVVLRNVHYLQVLKHIYSFIRFINLKNRRPVL